MSRRLRTDSPDLGVGLPQTGISDAGSFVADFAEGAEGAGAASLWTFERIIVPIHEHSYPGTSSGEYPPAMARSLDPLIALAVSASATSRIRLCTGVVIATLRHPVLLARQAASLDLLSKGRLKLGLGLGWSEREYEATNTSFQRRGDYFDEWLECFVALWSSEAVSFAGRHFEVPRAWVCPPPHSTGGPPIILGGYSPAAIRRAARLATGYLCGPRGLEITSHALSILHESLVRQGRDPSHFRIITRLEVPTAHEAKRQGQPMARVVDWIRAEVDKRAELDVDEVILDTCLGLGPKDLERPDDATMELDWMVSLLRELGASPGRDTIES